MSERSSDFINMPPPGNFTPEGDKLSDTNRSHPLGDKVDNTQGANAVLQSKITPTRQSSGHSLGMYSKPSWLCK